VTTHQGRGGGVGVLFEENTVRSFALTKKTKIRGGMGFFSRGENRFLGRGSLFGLKPFLFSGAKGKGEFSSLTKEEKKSSRDERAQKREGLCAHAQLVIRMYVPARAKKRKKPL